MPAAVLAALLLAGAPAAAAQVRVEAGRAAMGTLFRIVACAPDSSTGLSAIEGAFARIGTLEKLLTRRLPARELAGFEPDPNVHPKPMAQGTGRGASRKRPNPMGHAPPPRGGGSRRRKPTAKTQYGRG